MRKEKPISDLAIVLVAGGSGSRFGRQNKLFANLAGLPVFIHPLKELLGFCPPENLVLVAAEKDFAEFAKKLSRFLPACRIKMVKGGKTRMHSVSNGLNALSETAKFAAVHDAARPLATKELFLKCLKAARLSDGAVASKRITDTVKLADKKGFVLRTLDRSNLWRVETPQIFSVEKLLAAYKKAFLKRISVTDDAGVMEFSGYHPLLVEDTEPNIKITYPADLRAAELELKRRIGK